MAEAGEADGKGCVNCMTAVLVVVVLLWLVWSWLCWFWLPFVWTAPFVPPVVAPPRTPFGPIDCIVVSVVVSERTDGAGDEKVLSPPRRESSPPPAVLLVPARDEAPP